METPYPKLEEILKIVEESHDGKTVLPEFQRSFVWGNKDIEDLLVSILDGYFIGTFLFLRRRDIFDFKIRYFEGADKVNTSLSPEPDEKSVDKAVLDGQQRLTALFYVLYHPQDIKPKGASYPYRYFLKIHEKLNGEDWDDDVIWSLSENDSTKNIEINRGEGPKKYSFKEIIKESGGFGNLLEKNEFKQYCYENGVIPFSFLKSYKEFNKWLDAYVGHFVGKGEKYEKVTEKKESIRELFTNWFEFKVPALTLENKPFHEVAEIFERINRTGIELSVFALATAVFFKKGINLRNWWKEYYLKEDSEVKKFCKDDDDEEYPKYILQITALLKGKEVKKKVLINPKEFSIDRHEWDDACRLLDETLMRLQNTHTGYGVIQPDLLPYKPIIVCLAGLLNCCKSENDFRKLDAWYWSAVFTGRYARSSDTTIKEDFGQVREWLNNDLKKPGLVKKAESSIKDLELKDVDRGALYKAILNIIALKGAKDFFSGQSIELIKLNDHHIFPKKSGIPLTNENTILNRTLISDDTNRLISKKKPSQYLIDMGRKIGEGVRVKDVLTTHLIDEKAFRAMELDGYEDFLNAREELLKTEMKNRFVLQ